MTTGWGCHQRWLWVSETQSWCVIWSLQRSWEGQRFRQAPRGACIRAYACFCVPGPWSPARLSQKGQWIQISCFWLHGSVFSQRLLSLLHFPSRAHLFRGTSRQCPRVPRSSHAVQKRMRCHGSTSFPSKFDRARNKTKSPSETPEVSFFSTLTCPKILL